jgi:hypothetical protein
MEIDIIAVFTGQDGSLGYRYGQEYTLNLTYSPRIGKPTRVVICPDGNQIPCPYDSFRAFLKNWNNIRTAWSVRLKPSDRRFTRIEFTGDIIQYTRMKFVKYHQGMGSKRDAFIFQDIKTGVTIPIFCTDFPVKDYAANKDYHLYEFVFEGDINKTVFKRLLKIK